MPGPSGVIPSSTRWTSLGERPLAAILQASTGSSLLSRPWTPPFADTPNSFRSWHSRQYLLPPGLGPEYEPAPYKDVDDLETRGRSLNSSSRVRSSSRDRRVECADAGRRRSLSEPPKKQRKTFKLHIPAFTASTSLTSVSPLRAANTSQGDSGTWHDSSASPESNLKPSPTNSTNPSEVPKQASTYDLRTALEEVLKEGPAVEPTRQKMADLPAMITLRRASQAYSLRRPTLYSKMSAAASMASIDSFVTEASSPVTSPWVRGRKGLAADTAVTFTEVHASAASVRFGASETVTATLSGGQRPSTTSQIVCTKDSIYEVVWEDTLNLEPFRADGYNSSSGSSDGSSGHPDLQGYKPPTGHHRGGNQISTKLAAWSWNGGTEESSTQDGNQSQTKVRFRPLPDDTAGWMPATSLQEDEGLLPPPNSTNPSISATSESPTTSAESSANPSRTASVDHFSASASLLHPEGFSRHRSSTPSLTSARAPVAGNSKMGHALGAVNFQRTIMLLDKRTLSNLSSDERHFEYHRDSVALAQTRIFGDQNMFHAPRRFRDSIAIARTRFKQGGPYKRAKDDATVHRISVLSPIRDKSPPSTKGDGRSNMPAALGPSVAAGTDSPGRHIRFLSSAEGGKEADTHCLREAHEGGTTLGGPSMAR